ncbi:conserved Plasmodium protein, unknown function [Plasmodium ovale wallikeri]|uniref:Uncharacterized protein n=1 Tax=Plasmodium ovale wallikeri TaxID=864142 RepID=A0A1A8Z4Q5_PLAOA|nr:conserved Plasmodium protein, unknown function [Plasmodium ovale wallikeri]
MNGANVNDELDIVDYLLHKKEVKNIIENDGEDIRNFIISKKMNLTKEKNENIKNMKKLILRYPGIFVKTSIISRELEKNMQDSETLFGDINATHEKITKLFENDDYKREINDLKYSFDVDIPKNNLLNDIFKMPLLVHKYNEKENLQECIKCIKMCCKVRIHLHAYYNRNSNDEHVKHYLKTYEKSVEKEVEKTKKHVCDLIMKCENVDHLKIYLQYLSDIRNYFSLAVDITKMSKNSSNSEEKIPKSMNSSEEYNHLARKKKIYMNGSEEHNLLANKKNIYINSSANFINYDLSDKTNVDYVKDSFLTLKHYHILASVREQLGKKKNDCLLVNEIGKTFLQKIMNLKSIYEKLFNTVDANLYKHIIFIYYYALSLIHIKITQNDTSLITKKGNCVHNSGVNVCNNLKEEITHKASNNDRHDDNGDDCKEKSPLHENISSGEVNEMNSCASGKNAAGSSQDSFQAIPHTTTTNHFMNNSEKKTDNMTSAGEFKKYTNEGNIPNKDFSNPISTSKYPFLNLNSCIFNYMYYYVFFKEDEEVLLYSSEDDENEKKTKGSMDCGKFSNGWEINPICASGGLVQKKSALLKNHFSFIEHLYEEEDKKRELKREREKKSKDWNISKQNKHGKPGKRNTQKCVHFNHYTAIQKFAQSKKINETVMDLLTYRRGQTTFFLEEKIENGLEGVEVSVMFGSALGKILIMYIYDFLQKNNYFFYENILFFDEKENSETSDGGGNISHIVREHIRNQRERFLKNRHEFFFNFKGEDTNEVKNDKLLGKFTQEYYLQKIKEKLKYPFLITYFCNIMFILKNIKQYVDKFLFTVILSFKEEEKGDKRGNFGNTECGSIPVIAFAIWSLGYLSFSPLPLSPLPLSSLPFSPLPLSPLPFSPLPLSPLPFSPFSFTHVLTFSRRKKFCKSSATSLLTRDLATWQPCPYPLPSLHAPIFSINRFTVENPPNIKCSF